MIDAVFRGPGELEVAKAETPKIGSDGVLVKGVANTVCGTDVRILRGEKSKGIDRDTVLGRGGGRDLPRRPGGQARNGPRPAANRGGPVAPRRVSGLRRQVRGDVPEEARADARDGTPRGERRQARGRGEGEGHDRGHVTRPRPAGGRRGGHVKQGEERRTSWVAQS